DPPLAAKIEPGVSSLLPLYFAGKPDVMAQEVERLRGEYLRLGVGVAEKNYVQLLGEPAATVWLKAVLLLEYAAGLANKETMEIHTITADGSVLAGDKFFAFAGFINEEARWHDYNIGRKNARHWLKHGGGGLFPINASFAETLPEVDEGLGGWEIGHFDRKKRENLMAQARDRSGIVMKEMGVNAVLRGAIDMFVVRPRLKKMLGL
ncbi:MAG TPA: hypothetical protein VEA63_12495, partial [Opitutus sp.]|nr:hypothetical protein [Opitutus sp.]